MSGKLWGVGVSIADGPWFIVQPEVLVSKMFKESLKLF